MVHGVVEHDKGDESQTMLNLGFINNLDDLLDDSGLFLLLLLLSGVVGVALDVELEQVLDFLDFLNEGRLAGDHLLLGVGGSWNIALADALLGLVNLVELLVLVAVLATHGGNEEIVGGAEVELELGLLVLLLGRGGLLLVGAHF